MAAQTACSEMPSYDCSFPSTVQLRSICHFWASLKLQNTASEISNVSIFRIDCSTCHIPGEGLQPLLHFTVIIMKLLAHSRWKSVHVFEEVFVRQSDCMHILVLSVFFASFLWEASYLSRGLNTMNIWVHVFLSKSLQWGWFDSFLNCFLEVFPF